MANEEIGPDCVFLPGSPPFCAMFCAMRLAAGAARARLERPSAGPADWRTVLGTAAAVLTYCAWLFAG